MARPPQRQSPRFKTPHGAPRRHEGGHATPKPPVQVDREGPAPARGQCTIIHKDMQLCLVDKGPGLLTVTTDTGNPPTVMGALAHRLKGAHDQLFPVHRLDRDTSGVLVVARTRRALHFLVAELKQRTFQRVYLALVKGTPPPCGTLRGHLGTVGKDLRMRTVDEGEGKLAITHFRVVEQGKDVALVAFKLDTGRRNQIRAQVAELGFPLLGEAQYADNVDGMDRQALHSHRLTIPHPDGGWLLTAMSPLPEDMMRAWHRAGGRHGPVLRPSFEIPGPDAPVFELKGSGDDGGWDADERPSRPPSIASTGPRPNRQNTQDKRVASGAAGHGDARPATPGKTQERPRDAHAGAPRNQRGPVAQNVGRGNDAGREQRSRPARGEGPARPGKPGKLRSRAPQSR